MAQACLGSERSRGRCGRLPVARGAIHGRVEGGYATGRIDLVFREGDGLVVVDWKSDSVGPSQVNAAAELHGAQAAAYARKLSKAQRRSQSRKSFLFCPRWRSCWNLQDLRR